jgi:hypothetical protein
MKGLSKAICDIMVKEYGTRELLVRLSNPDWFQALGCVLAFDWHSSGTTTVLCGVLRSVLDPEEHGLAMVGGKGRRARQVPGEISDLADIFSLGSSRRDSLVRSSRLSAKVDTALLQDGFDIYHHAMFVSDSCRWSVVQQGMNPESGTARRYHWSSEGLAEYVEEPHSGIACDVIRRMALDMTSKESRSCRGRSLRIANAGGGELLDALAKIHQGKQRTLLDWGRPGEHVPFRNLPPRLNWRAMDRIYDFKPSNYEELVLVRGVGASTVRALALVSELVYGDAPSWRDPVKYSYCLGGKDGVPHPVDRASYDESIEILGNAINDAKLGDLERMRALRRLRDFVPRGLRESRPPWLARAGGASVPSAGAAGAG